MLFACCTVHCWILCITFICSFVSIGLCLVQSSTIAHMMKHTINLFKVKVKNGHQNAFIDLMWHTHTHTHNSKPKCFRSIEYMRERQTNKQASQTRNQPNQPPNQHTFGVYCSGRSIEPEILNFDFRYTHSHTHSYQAPNPVSLHSFPPFIMPLYLHTAIVTAIGPIAVADMHKMHTQITRQKHCNVTVWHKIQLDNRSITHTRCHLLALSERE